MSLISTRQKQQTATLPISDVYGVHLCRFHNHHDRDPVAANVTDGARNDQHRDGGLTLTFDRDGLVLEILKPSETEICGVCVPDVHDGDGDDDDVPCPGLGHVYVFHYDRARDAHDLVCGHGHAIYRALTGDLGPGRLSLALKASRQNPFQ